MDCPNCARANREQANYCRFCGAHFNLGCPRCRAVLVADSAFCDHCGYRLSALSASAAPLPVIATALAPSALAAPAPQSALSQLHQYIPAELMQKLEAARAKGEMVGERRIVTMLFCDVQGSTAAAVDRLGVDRPHAPRWPSRLPQP